MNKANIAREYRDKYGHEMPTKKLARIMYAENPLLFTDIEQARSYLRKIEGKQGKGDGTIISHKMEERRPNNPYNLPESFAVTREAFRLPKDCKKVLYLPDQHIPYHDIRANTIAIDRGVKDGADTVILTGDVLDQHKVSKYQSDPRKRDIMQEFEAAKDYLESLRNTFPDSKIYWIKGNHCHVEDTEVLTDSGFKKFTELKSGDLLAQFDMTCSNCVSYDEPISLIAKHYCGDVYDIENNYSRQVVTEDHDVIVSGKKKKAKDVTLEDVKNIVGYGEGMRGDYDIHDDMIRLLVNIVCDATLVTLYETKTPKRRVQFKLSKERKIENLTGILNRLGVEYTIRKANKSGINILQPYYICIYKRQYVDAIFDLLNGIKEFPKWFLEFSQRQTKIVYEELGITDGSFKDSSLYLISVNKSDIDLLQILFLRNGIKTKITPINNGTGFANGKQQYKLKARILPASQTAKIEKRHYDGFVYCAEMDKGTLITRYNGKVAFSGNCTRYEKFLLEKVHELWKDPYYHLEERLELNKYRIQIFSDKQVIKAGNLNVTHGHYIINSPWGSVNPAKTVYDKTGNDYLIGHVHKNFEFKKINADGRLTRCYTMGCLSEIRPDYNPIVSNYMHGFAIQEIDPNTGEYELDNVHIKPNQSYYL